MASGKTDHHLPDTKLEIVFAVRTIAFIIISLLAAIQTESAQNFEYGLHINTYPAAASDQFTSLLLDEGKLIQTKGKTVKISFQVCNRPENIFGTVFRIITDDGENIDLMYSIDREDIHYPILVAGESVTRIESTLRTEEWFPVSISLNPKDGGVELDFDGVVTSIKDAGTKGADGFRIAFGKCPLSGYTLDDVASTDIKDIVVSRNGEEIRHWPLSLHDGQDCRDILHKSVARGSNTTWIIDQYVTWKPVTEIEFKNSPSVAFDPDGTFYLTDDGKDLKVFNVRDNSMSETSVISGEYPANAPNQLIYDKKRERLIAYNLDESTGAHYNPEARKWEGGKAATKDHDFWNNSSSFDSESGRIVSFGGYGHYHYNNRLVILDPSNGANNFSKIVEEITPRYGSASVIVDSLLYIFGGRGNVSGKQELSPKYYFELYTINLKSLKTEKIWSLKDIAADFVCGEDMIYDRDADCFYVMTNIGGGTLVKIGRTVPKMDYMSLDCGVIYNSQYWWTNLFLNSGRDKLYAVITKSQVDGASKVHIFEMNYPPIPVNALHQALGRKEKTNEEKFDAASWTLRLALPLLALVLATLTACIVIKKRKTKKSEKKNEYTHGSESEEYVPETVYYDLGRSSVSFFGGFKVMDKEGNDITSQFTPTLKSLLVLLILFTAKDSNGIISGKLNHLLWSYKPEDSANNNRNVYISKLRAVLEQVGDIKIANQNKFWSISFGEGTICDYLEAMRLYNEPDCSDSAQRLLELLLKGQMLPNLELDWMDDFKSEFSNKMIDFLCQRFKRSDLPDKVLLCATDTIFQYDFLNEEALKVKCSILYRQGKAGLAKSIFDTFRKDYRTSLGIDCPVTFKELIES